LSPEPQKSVAGTAFGKYKLLAKLAIGGMGEIFLARLSGVAGFEKLVVIKRLLPHLAEDGHFVAMLLDEARIAARLNHPNVCQTYDLGEVDGQYFIAMEYLEGAPASQLLSRVRRSKEELDLRMACAIVLQSCEGLHHAHELKDNDGELVGLVHRDVSPSNVFVTVAGAVKILDFGVAKSQDALARTHTGALKGKYAYMSPEQILSKDIDRRSDIFSLGIVLFELLTTRRLFWRDSEYKMFQAIAEDDIPSVLEYRPDVPGPIADVVDRALSRDREERYATAKDMAEALSMACAPLGGPMTTGSIAEFVEEAFSDQIRERRQLVKTVAHSRAGAATAPARAITSEATPSAPNTSATVAQPLRRKTETEAVDAILDEITKSSGSRGKWIALSILVLLGLGGGAYAFVTSEKAPAQPAPQIIVQQYPTPATPGTAPNTNDPGGVAIAVAPDAAAPAKASPPDAAPPVVDNNDQKDPRPPRPKGQDYFTKRFAKRSGAIKQCVTKHAADFEGTPTVKVSIKVATSGKVSSASLSPANLGASPLGKCIIGVARGINFGRIQEEVRVTIPFRLKRRGG
jgi:serine/threonine-protein kinase